jgi:hypothetical protein
MAGLMHASIAASTWSRYGTGWRTFEAFEQHAGTVFDWPLSRETLQAFVGYCLIEKKLKPTSVKTYLSSIVKLHKLKGYPDFELKDGTITALLRGAANLLDPVFGFVAVWRPSGLAPGPDPGTRRSGTDPQLFSYGIKAQNR